MRALLLSAALLPLPALAQEVTATDAYGHAVTLPAPPERIVCLSINCAEEMAFLGVTPIALGSSFHGAMAALDLFGEEMGSIAAVGDTDGYDLEALAALAPDLIIAYEGDQAGMAGIAPVYATNVELERLADQDLFLHDLRALAGLLGRAEEGAARIRSALDRQAAYAALVPEDRVGFATIYVVDGGASFWVSPDCNMFIDPLVDCAHPGGADWIQAGPELLLSMDPEVVVVDDYGEGEAEILARVLNEDPVWMALSAAEAGRVHLVDGNLSRMRTIASVGLGLDTIMPLLYPDTFPAPLTDAQVAAALQE